MTEREGKVLLKTLKAMTEIVEHKIEVAEAATEIEGSDGDMVDISFGGIGPKFDNLAPMADQIKALPMAQEEYEALMGEIEMAIATESRKSQMVDSVTFGLTMLRQLMPMLAAI